VLLPQCGLFGQHYLAARCISTGCCGCASCLVTLLTRCCLLCLCTDVLLLQGKAWQFKDFALKGACGDSTHMYSM
jgi:hypothetical protein